jgi:hypothetical protein
MFTGSESRYVPRHRIALGAGCFADVRLAPAWKLLWRSLGRKKE